MFLVSACLAGETCRYDGAHCACPPVRELVRCGGAIAVCPEVLGGLPVPRERCEQVKDPGGSIRIVSEQDNDFTAQYALGARAALAIARANQVTAAILKSLSPSCGVGEVYDGTFAGTRIVGDGLAARLLSAHGIRVHTELDLPAELALGSDNDLPASARP